MPEVVYSQTEKIGLPNWSNVTLLVSAKRMDVGSGAESVVFDALSEIVNYTIRAQSEKIAKGLAIWAGVEHEDDELVPPEFDEHPRAITELTFSMTETIALPTTEKGQNSTVNLLASIKDTCQAGAEIQTYETLAALVSKQMAEKRTMVKKNVRPWTSA